jgi:hypothetical protein
MKLRDFSDWRVMREQATVTIHNVTAGVLNARLKVAGVAPQQSKSVSVGERAISFPANKPVDAAIGPLLLQPGRNVVTLTDPSWSRKQVPLLVKRVRVEAVEED